MKTVLKYIEANRDRYLSELTELIAIPSISTNPENTKDIARCAEAIMPASRTSASLASFISFSPSSMIPFTPLQATSSRSAPAS